MTTTLHLIRHGTHGRLGHVLCGRMEGVGLSDEGAAQARAIAPLIGRADALYTSPIQRTRETAEPLAAALGVKPQVDADLQEIDFGAWTGRRFDQLSGDPLWDAWNARRSLTRPPGGETMGEVQMRAARAVERVRAASPEGVVALVTHGDVIKGLLCLWLGIDLDLHHRLEVEPASVSTAVVGDWGVKALRVNATAAHPNEEPRP